MSDPIDSKAEETSSTAADGAKDVAAEAVNAADFMREPPSQEIPHRVLDLPTLDEEGADGPFTKEDEAADYDGAGTEEIADDAGPKRKRVRRQKRRKCDPAEARLRGRRDLCKRIADIAPYMLKTVKLRVLGGFLNSTKGLTDEDLTERIKRDAPKIAARDRILNAFSALDDDVDVRNLKWIILIGILLQEETYSLEESKLEEKVVEFEKQIVKQAKNLDFFDKKKHDDTMASLRYVPDRA